MFLQTLTVAGFRERCLNTRPTGRVLKHLPRDPASVNAMKQTYICDRFSCIVYLIPTKFALNIHFLTLNISKRNCVDCKLSNVITLSQRHSCVERFREQKASAKCSVWSAALSAYKVM